MKIMCFHFEFYRENFLGTLSIHSLMCTCAWSLQHVFHVLLHTAKVSLKLPTLEQCNAVWIDVLQMFFLSSPTPRNKPKHLEIIFKLENVGVSTREEVGESSSCCQRPGWEAGLETDSSSCGPRGALSQVACWWFSLFPRGIRPGWQVSAPRLASN